MKKIFLKILKWGSIAAVIVFIVGAVGAGLLINKAYKELPDVGKLIDGYNPVVPSKVYDVNGEVIDIIYKEIRETATIDEMPQYLKDAYVSIEDRNFYKHHGLDTVVFAHVMVKNVMSGKMSAGASSITQQLVKNAFLSNEKKIMRKVKELMIAFELERTYTKDEILEKYLNEIYFSSGAYGVKTAAKVFYGKSIEDINLAESALLAGVPNRPNYYNPRKHLDNAVYRQKVVLSQMKKYGYITDAEYNDALSHKFYNEGKEPKEYKEKTREELDKLKVTIIKNQSKKRSYTTPDFTNIVEEKLSKLFTEKEIYEEGLQVYTTLDIGMQKAAKETFENYSPLVKDKELNGGMVTIESHSGYVRAIIGGKGFKSGDYNRAILAKRQPGSSFKPFVYFTALRLGYPMNTVIEDTKVKFGKWQPNNYGNSFRKNMTLLEGMEDSVNIVAIKTLQKVGLKELDKTVNLAGGENLVIPQNLTAALGTTVVTPLELSTIYLPFSNGGYKVKPIFITEIKNRYGKTVYKGHVEQEKVFDGNDVALITHMMKDVVKHGTGRNATVRKDGIPIAQGGKTGTTNKQRTAWFAGITPKYVTTVYMGYDDNGPMPRANTGGGLTARFWGQYYQRLVDDGYNTGNHFTHITDGIKNGSLTEVEIDSRNGRLADSTSGINKRWGLFKIGTEPTETASIYNRDFDDFFEKPEKEILENFDNVEKNDNQSDKNDDSSFKGLFD